MIRWFETSYIASKDFTVIGAASTPKELSWFKLRCDAGRSELFVVPAMVRELIVEMLRVSFVTSLLNCFIQFCVHSQTHLLCCYCVEILTSAIQKSATLHCITWLIVIDWYLISPANLFNWYCSCSFAFLSVCLSYIYNSL